MKKSLQKSTLPGTTLLTALQQPSLASNIFAQARNRKTALAMFFTFLFSIQFASAQKIDTADVNTQEGTYKFYMQKAKANRTGAFVVLGTGIALMAGGAFIASRHVFDHDGDVGVFPFLLGTGLTIGSIPLFIATHSNKKKAALVLKRENSAVGDIHAGSFNYVAIGLRLHL